MLAILTNIGNKSSDFYIVSSCIIIGNIRNKLSVLSFNTDFTYFSRMLVPMVDTIFADVAQPDQARIVAINAQYFLKVGGHFVISVKVTHI